MSNVNYGSRLKVEADLKGDSWALCKDCHTITPLGHMHVKAIFDRANGCAAHVSPAPWGLLNQAHQLGQRGQELFLVQCPHCNGEMIPVDAAVAPILRAFNEAGFHTARSCAGHSSEQHPTITLIRPLPDKAVDALRYLVVPPELHTLNNTLVDEWSSYMVRESKAFNIGYEQVEIPLLKVGQGNRLLIFNVLLGCSTMPQLASDTIIYQVLRALEDCPDSSQSPFRFQTLRQALDQTMLLQYLEQLQRSEAGANISAETLDLLRNNPIPKGDREVTHHGPV